MLLFVIAGVEIHQSLQLETFFDKTQIKKTVIVSLTSFLILDFTSSTVSNVFLFLELEFKKYISWLLYNSITTA